MQLNFDHKNSDCEASITYDIYLVLQYRYCSYNTNTIPIYGTNYLVYKFIVACESWLVMLV